MKVIPENLAWAAGFYEGEGSISFVRKPRTRGKYETFENSLCMTITNTDRETLDRFVVAVGVGKVYGPYQKASAKPIYHYTISRFEQVQHVVAVLWPWLSWRRRDQATVALTGCLGGRRAQYFTRGPRRVVAA